MQTTTTGNNIGGSQAPSSQPLTNNKPSLQSLVTDPAAKWAEEGIQAVKELERILFFTDISEKANNSQSSDSKNDNPYNQESTAEDGLRAIHDLERVLNLASQEGQDVYSAGSTQTKDESETNKAASSSAALGLPTSAVATLNTTLDLLKKNIQSALEAGRQAVKTVEQTSQQAAKEARRKFLFTDVDERALAQKNPTGASIDVHGELQTMLAELEQHFSKLAIQSAPAAIAETGQRFAKGVGETGQRVLQQSHALYKECERTLLFTDLDESALAKDKTNDDVITHFLNTQQVFQELERKVLFTGLDAKKDDSAGGKAEC